MNPPYRSALAWAAAVAEIRRGAGTRFDPAVVQLLGAVQPELEALFHEYRAREAPPADAWSGGGHGGAA